jgi:hypothetical protein
MGNILSAEQKISVQRELDITKQIKSSQNQIKQNEKLVESRLTSLKSLADIRI